MVTQYIAAAWRRSVHMFELHYGLIRISRCSLGKLSLKFNPQQISASIPSFVFIVLLAGFHSAFAQTAKISVNVSSEVNVLTATSIGIPAALFDAAAFSPATAPYLRLAGAGLL